MVSGCLRLFSVALRCLFFVLSWAVCFGLLWFPLDCFWTVKVVSGCFRLFWVVSSCASFWKLFQLFLSCRSQTRYGRSFLQGVVLSHTSSVLALTECLADRKVCDTDLKEKPRATQKATREKAETALKGR